MENKKLQTKDLITVGVFTAIYFVLFLTVGMLGYVPIFYVLLPFLLPIVCGIPFMLFLTKVKSFGMVTIMGTILGALVLLTGGQTFIPIITGLIFGLLADFILLTGKYQSKRFSVLAHGIFSLWWMLGTLVPFWFMRDSFEKMMLDNMGADYTRVVLTNFDKISWAFPFLTFVGGIIGAFVGLAMLKKHFKKAGIA